MLCLGRGWPALRGQGGGLREFFFSAGAVLRGSGKRSATAATATGDLHGLGSWVWSVTTLHSPNSL